MLRGPRIIVVGISVVQDVHACMHLITTVLHTGIVKFHSFCKTQSCKHTHIHTNTCTHMYTHSHAYMEGERGNANY